jgi:biopolymer transport protein ExbD
VSFAGGGGRGRVRSDINITPLVDVVLVLLIIFMVMTPILLKQLDVKVPEKADAELSTPPPTASQVVLRIAADGTLALNLEPLPRERLGDTIRDTFAPRRDKLLFFDIDDAANYGLVVEVMDECRGAGVKTLGIMTK